MSSNESNVPASTTASMESLQSRLWLTRLLVVALIGLVVGAALGAVASAVLGQDHTATAYLRLQNPADLTAIAGGATQTTPDLGANTSDFVTGEIAYLSGEGFAQAVARKMAEDQPAELQVAQESKSSVVTLSSTGGSTDEAARTVQTAIDLYRDDLSQRMDAQLRLILPTLDTWERNSGGDPVRLQDIRRLRDSVTLQAAQAGGLLVIQPPTPDQPGSTTQLAVIAGAAIVVAALAVGVMMLLRRRSGRGALVTSLSRTVDRVLLPAVDLSLPARHLWGEDQNRLGRTLFAQCPTTQAQNVIAVAGVSSASGTATVAALFDRAADEMVATASATSGQHASADPDGPSTARVLAVGAVGDSGSVAALGEATTVVLVARIGVDTESDALSARAAVPADRPVVVAFTYRGVRTMARRHPDLPEADQVPHGSRS